MDLRVFFKAQQKKNEQKQAKSKIPLIIDEDEDDEDFKDSAAPKQPTGSKCGKNVAYKSRKRTRQRLADDSDSDTEVPSKKSKSKSIPVRTSPRKTPSVSKPQAGKKATQSKPPKKEISSISSFFGSDPIKRAAVKTPVKEKMVDKREIEEKKKVESSPLEDLYEIPESPLDTVTIDDEEIARALQGEEMKEQAVKEEQIHQDEVFSKTLAELDKKVLVKPPTKKLKLMMERVPISRSPYKTPTGTPTKTKSPSKSTPQKATVTASAATKRWSKKGIQYEDDDDDDFVMTSSSTAPSKPVKPVSPQKPTTKKSPTKLPTLTTPKSLSKTKSSTPVSRTPTTTPTSPHRPLKKQSATPEPITSSTASKVSPSTDTPKPSRSESYRHYLNRGGPKALGSKPIPEGQEGCLEGLTFVITGVLDSLERGDAAELIKKYGGKVTGSVSGRTSYVVVGEDAGESKLAKADKFGTKRIDEDGLLEFIKTRPAGGKASASVPAKKKPPAKQKSASPPKKPPHTHPSPKTKSHSASATMSPTVGVGTSKVTKKGTESLLWVDKYRPKSTKAIVGQTGEKSNAKKLAKWLCNWDSNHLRHEGGGVKRPMSGRDDGSSFKAALLSGPPGIGKTTTATLVCEENGFSYIEMNASAKRNKAALHGEVAAQLGSLSIESFVGGDKGGASSGHKHVLIMDEVDGMAGNEDRGGMQELISMIKTTKTPIICICNDRQSPKVRSLANYCYDLRFQKPRAEQIKGAMMSVCYKEGIKIEPSALMEMIIASRQDVRQVLHNLSLWGTPDKPLSAETARESAKNTQKHSKKGPFDVVRLVFAPREGERELSLLEKSDHFFHDYTIAALFVQENYLSAKPASARGDPRATLKCMARAADSLCEGDLIEKQIRRTNQWGLLPAQAFFSSVIPGEEMKGFLGRPEFPRWLGQNSKRAKCDRILQELKRHTHLMTSCTKTEFGLDYLPFLSSKLIHPLLEKGSEGVPEVISVMETYDLLKEDWDSIQELAHFSGHPDRVSQIPSKVKSQFTRTYNKDKHMLHYTTESKKPKKRTSVDTELYEEEEGSGIVSDSEDDSIESDSMIKVKDSKTGKAGKMAPSNGPKKAKPTKKGKK